MLFIVPRIVVVEAAACGAMLLWEQHASASSVAALRGGFCVQRGRSFSRALEDRSFKPAKQIR